MGLLKIKLLARAPLCPFDGKPCQRALSPIDGDLDCGGLVYFDFSGELVTVVPVCDRYVMRSSIES